MEVKLIKKPADVKVKPHTPAVRDTERTRANIIKFATKEFAMRGFDGARVDRIAARCKLSKNTLYYHFGSKEGLIVAVLEHMYVQLRERQGNENISTDNPAEALRQLSYMTFRSFVENPQIIVLLNEENLHKGHHLKGKNFIRNLYDPLFDKIKLVLAEGQKRNIFRPGVQAHQVYLTMSSMAYHFISNSYTLEIALGINLSTKEAQDEWADHISNVISAYCCLPGANSQAA